MQEKSNSHMQHSYEFFFFFLCWDNTLTQAIILLFVQLEKYDACWFSWYPAS